ncbi:hypothetical protein FACS1894172_15550 [Spirochaetia bacterium]|nr:hypothetical protein FACS1894164_04200 [Spirochaetia bacterium]GHU34786.1 hypothetical protein FACS1894172_15550 [Spirochaetia bacterium]
MPFAEDFFTFGDDAGIAGGALEKALTAGYGTDAALFTGGRALQIEDLEMTLVNVMAAQREDCKLMNTLKTLRINSTVHQFDVRKDVGDYENLFAEELAIPEASDQDIKRLFVMAKYIQNRRSVSHQATVVRTTADVLAEEKIAGTLNVLKGAEYACFHGDSAVVPEQYDGLIAQIVSDSKPNITDLRGQTITGAGFDPFDSMVALIYERGGEANKMFFPVVLAMQMQELVRDRILFSVADKKMSTVVDQFPTPLGTVFFGEDAGADKLFKVKGAVNPSGNIEKRPSAPVSVTLAAAAQSGSQFLKTTDLGAYTYRVFAVNAAGISEGTAPAAAATVASGNGVTITITPGARQGSGFIIARSLPGSTDVMEMVRIPNSGNATTVYVDLNSDLPGTASLIFITERKVQPILQFGQLLPLQLYPLYPGNRAETPFIVQLYGALINKAPEWCGLIKNIGYSGGFAYA